VSIKRKKAIIGVSDTSGLNLLKKEDLDPLQVNTLGTGELIKAALDIGAEKIVIGVGGSATVDGGTGLFSALGIRYFDENGNETYDLPSALVRLNSIDIASLDKRVQQVEIIVLCDVKNTLLGNKGAAMVFGPQKGANKEEVILSEKTLSNGTIKPFRPFGSI
jgi:glycerate kinase